MNANGNLATTFVMTENTTFSATFVGDYRSAPAAVSQKHLTRARVTTIPLGWFKKVGSIAVYHAGAIPRFAFTVAPSRPNGCIDVVAQRLSGGVWKTVAAATCFHLEGDSASIVGVFGFSKPGKMRIAAAVPSDWKTYAGASVWQYYSFI